MEVSYGLVDAHGLLVLVLTMMSILFKLTYKCNESRGGKKSQQIVKKQTRYCKKKKLI